MGKHFRLSEDHVHDWRKEPGSSQYRFNEEGQYQTRIWCAACPATAWANEDGLLTTWPIWNGPVCDVTEEQDKPAPSKGDGMASYAKRHRAKTTSHGVVSYCCDEGHETFAEALEHGRQISKKVTHG